MHSFDVFLSWWKLLSEIKNQFNSKSKTLTQIVENLQGCLYKQQISIE